jgi:hypothetical protein
MRLYKHYEFYSVYLSFSDVNECANKTLTKCKSDQNQTERCINLYGSYFCYCAQGWTGTYCENGINH